MRPAQGCPGSNPRPRSLQGMRGRGPQPSAIPPSRRCGPTSPRSGLATAGNWIVLSVRGVRERGATLQPRNRDFIGFDSLRARGALPTPSPNSALLPAAGGGRDARSWPRAHGPIAGEPSPGVPTHSRLPSAHRVKRPVRCYIRGCDRWLCGALCSTCLEGEF